MEAQIFQEPLSEKKQLTYAKKSLLAEIGSKLKHNLPLPNFYCKIERIKINE